MTVFPHAPTAPAPDAPAPLRPQAEPSPGAIDAFLRWFESRGGDAGALEIATVDGLRGVRAKRDVARGEVVLLIPYAAALSVETAKASRIGQVISAAAADAVNVHGYIAAFILDSLRHEGVWAPYLRVMPADFSDHPLFFTDDDMAYMQGSFAALLSRKYRKTVAHDFERINAALAEEERFDIEDFRWAWCCALTRMRGRETGPDTFVDELQVMSDMLNHAEPANIEWSENETGCVLRATRDVAAGELLTDSYGMKGNHALLATWGFRLDANPHDELYLMLDAGPATAPGTQASAVPRRLMSVRRRYRHSKTHQVVAYLRHRHHHLQSDPGASPPPVSDAALHPISRANELAALTSLGEACLRRRIAFGPPVAGGEPVPDAAPDLPRRLRHAVTVLQEEVQLLEHYECLVSEAISFLEEPELATPEAWRARINDDDYFHAIRRLVSPPAG